MKRKASKKRRVGREKIGSLKDRTDRVFSDMIRTRDRGVCQFHKLARERKIPISFECSGSKVCFHILSRRFHSIRFDQRNAFCACSAANKWERENRDVWIKDIAPKMIDDFEELWKLKGVLVHRKANDYRTMIQYFYWLIHQG